MRKTKEKIISLSLTLALIASLLPGLSITARAATLPYGMTTSSIGVGSGSTLASSTTQIGFGGQRWYVVGFNGTGIDKGSEYVTLLAKGSMGSSAFWKDPNNPDSNSTSYSGSTLQSFINNLPNSYDSREQALMVGLTLDEVSGTQPTNQKIWALGVTEASTVSSSVRELADGAWVLRTMSQYNTARTVSAGVVNNFGPPNTTLNCVRPGTSLNLSKVLYTSPISGAKDTTVGTMNSVALSSEVKFTILDSNLSLNIASAPASLTKAQGSSISLNFSGAQTGTGKYVSCVLVSNSDSLAKYYAKLSADASGTLSIPISADIMAGSYTLLIYNEEICSGDYSDYASTPISISLTVTGSANTAPTLISGVSSTDSVSVSVNSAYTLKLSDIFTDIDGNTLTYRVYTNGSSTAVPADENYSFTPKTAGTTTLRFTAYDGAAESAPYTVTLTAGNVLATGITVTGENGATCIGKNGSLQLHYSFQPSNTTNQNVTWTVTMSTQAGEGSVDAGNMLRTSGVVDPSWGNGKATIRATAQDGSGVFGELVLPVLQNIVTGIIVNASETNVAIGDTTQMSATVSPTEAKQDITWSISSGSGIASVSTTGLVTLTGSGTVTVRATAQDGSGLFGEKTLTVKALQVAPSAPTMASKTETTITLNAITGAEYSTDTYTWQSGTTFTDLEPNTAYSFYARMAGTDTLKVSSSSPALSVTTEKATLGGSVSITGTFKCGQNLNVNTSGMTADPSCSLGTISYQWTRDGSNISGATGSTYSLVAADLGKVINVTVAAENCTGNISSSNSAATAKGDPDYTAPTGLMAAWGDTLEDVVLPEGFSWEGSETTDVGELGDHNFTVKYTPDDTTNYNIITNISVTITVGKKDPNCTAAPAASAITYGQTLADSILSGGTSDVEGNFAWATETTEPSVSDSDTTEYSVTFTPTDTEHYNAINVPVKLTVNKAMSSITSTPAASAITYGQMLSESILSGGSGSVAGSFAWTDGATKPSVSDSNTTAYSVTFTPIDNNYAPSTTTVTLVVNKSTSSVAAPTNGIVTDGETNTFSFTVVSGYGMLPLYEYTANGTTWIALSASNATLIDSTITISVGNISGTVQVRVKESGDHSAGTVLTSSAFTGSIEGTVTIAGTAKCGQMLTANVIGAQSDAIFSYQWERTVGGITSNIGTGSTYTLSADDIGATITVTATATNYDVTLKSAATEAVVEASVPAAPSAPTAATVGTDSITLNSIANAEYSKDGIIWQDSPTFGELSTATSYTFYARIKETGGQSASENSSVATIYTRPAAPDASDAIINYANETISFGTAYEMNTASTFDGLTIVTGDNISNYVDSYIYIRQKAVVNGTPESTATAIAVPARSTTAPTISNVSGTLSAGFTVAATVTVTESGTFVYRVDNGTWQTSNVFAGLGIGTAHTFEAAYAATASAFHSASDSEAKTWVSSDFTAAQIATLITTINAPTKDTTSMTLPTVPPGFTVVIKHVSPDATVLAISGTITPPSAETTVKVVLTVTKTSDSTTADTAEISVIIPAKTVSNSGSGSSSSSTTANGVSVPISSNTGTANVSASVSGSTATISAANSQLSTIASASKDTGTITVDVSGLKVNAATIPSKVVSAVQRAEGSEGLAVALPTGTVALDKPALAFVEDKGDVKFSVETVNNSKLTDSQKATLGSQAGFATVVDVNVYAGSSKVSTFGDGKITVSVPYTLKSGENSDSITVWFINDNGSIEPKTASYSNGKVTFTTEHLSQYLIVNFPFADVAESAWCYGSVAYAYNNGLFDGTSATAFSPNATATRQMIWMVLARMDGKTPANMAEAKAWAVENGISDGSNPTGTITRQQMAAILYRYAQHKGYDTTQGGMAIREFSDYGSISTYAQSALAWAVNAELVQGSHNQVMPFGDATRAQVATILQRFSQNLAK